MRFLLTICGALGLAVSIPAEARNLIVPDSAPTIQAALDSIYPGMAPIDTVFVRAGSYHERVQGRMPLLLIGIPTAAGQPPEVDALSLWDEAGGMGTILFSRLRFRGQVNVTIAPGGVEFSRCQMDSGITCELDPPRSLRLVRCAIRGQVSAFGEGVVELDSCTVNGRAVMNIDDRVTIRACEFMGGGVAAIAVATYHGSIEGNHVHGFDTGIQVGFESDGTVRDNVVEDCPWEGIRVRAEAASIVDNKVARCGTGIHVEGAYDGNVVSRNEILDCSAAGLAISADRQCEVGHNVVGRCGGDGIQLTTGGYGSVGSVRSNTVFGNRGSGLTVYSEPYAQVALENNIASGNAGYGLLSSGASAPAASCNDWYLNGAGPVGGVDPAGTGWIVDPGFCDLAAGDVRLRSDSPLVDAAGCGQIGALGVGCGAATLSRLRIGPNPSSEPVGIEFGLTREADVTVEVIDVQGRLVATLARGRVPAGNHRVEWSGRDPRGAIAPAGVYSVRYRSPEGEQVQQIVRVR
jgi:hypothetical protein